jgi:hypothetical protein
MQFPLATNLLLCFSHAHAEQKKTFGQTAPETFFSSASSSFLPKNGRKNDICVDSKCIQVLFKTQFSSILSKVSFVFLFIVECMCKLTGNARLTLVLSWCNNKRRSVPTLCDVPLSFQFHGKYMKIECARSVETCSSPEFNSISPGTLMVALFDHGRNKVCMCEIELTQQ